MIHNQDRPQTQVAENKTIDISDLNLSVEELEQRLELSILDFSSTFYQPVVGGNVQILPKCIGGWFNPFCPKK